MDYNSHSSTTDGSVKNINGSPKQYVTAAIDGNSCMLTWIGNADPTYSAYFESINPFSPNPVTVYPVVDIGFCESPPITAALNGYFVSIVRANEGSGATIFSTATTPSNWGVFSLFTPPSNPDGAPWVVANQTGFMSAWSINGNPIWTFTSNNGFTQTPLCSILATSSSTIFAPIALGSNARGFVATWLDTNDNNAYASFYFTPAPISASANLFVGLLQQNMDHSYKERKSQ